MVFDFVLMEKFQAFEVSKHFLEIIRQLKRLAYF
jgi:hypothetical protein